MTELNDLKAKLDEHAYRPDLMKDPVFNALGLAEEAGEVAGKVRKWLRGDDGPNPTYLSGMLKERRMAIVIEAGDVLFNWVYLLDSIGVSPETAFTILLDKIASRKARGTQAGEGDDR